MWPICPAHSLNITRHICKVKKHTDPKNDWFIPKRVWDDSMMKIDYYCSQQGLPTSVEPTHQYGLYTEDISMCILVGHFFCGAWAPQGIHWSPWWPQEFLVVACRFSKWLELDFENECLWNLPPPCLCSNDLPHCIAGKLEGDQLEIAVAWELPCKLNVHMDGQAGRTNWR